MMVKISRINTMCTTVIHTYIYVPEHNTCHNLMNVKVFLKKLFFYHFIHFYVSRFELTFKFLCWLQQNEVIVSHNRCLHETFIIIYLHKNINYDFIKRFDAIPATTHELSIIIARLQKLVKLHSRNLPIIIIIIYNENAYFVKYLFPYLYNEDHVS